MRPHGAPGATGKSRPLKKGAPRPADARYHAAAVGPPAPDACVEHPHTMLSKPTVETQKARPFTAGLGVAGRPLMPIVKEDVVMPARAVLCGAAGTPVRVSTPPPKSEGQLVPLTTSVADGKLQLARNVTPAKGLGDGVGEGIAERDGVTVGDELADAAGVGIPDAGGVRVALGDEPAEGVGVGVAGTTHETSLT